MKIVPQIFIVLLLITQNFAENEETLQNREIIPELTSENSLRNEELETILYITTENSVINELLETTTTVAMEIQKIKDESTTTINLSNNEIFSQQDIVSENSAKLENEETVVTNISLSEYHADSKQEILSQDSYNLENGKEIVWESSNKTETTNSEIVSENSNKIETKNEEIASEVSNAIENVDLSNVTNNLEELKEISEKSTELEITTKTTNKEIVSEISSTIEKEELPNILKVLKPVTNNFEEISKKSTEPQLTTKTTIKEIVAETSSTTENEKLPNILKVLKPVKNLEEFKEISEKSTELQSKQEENNDNSENYTESLIEDPTTTTIEYELTAKPLTTLEDYALKQMNFILDNLLIETQEFIANVLQASVNMVFQRDHLKRYAEGLNRVLNPSIDSEYSDEIIEDTKVLTQDELYEEIILKLNFLKSKPSRYLQRILPQNWIKEYVNKRAELIIWLDKACEQMHQEFNLYVSEEEDYIKYQYFNEAFDDISRATEIHQKLALLADLVKIVKNKKQITFMDLYMQT